jgi:phosphoribosylformylglycinamidine (FGAM) synthase-like enzyme
MQIGTGVSDQINNIGGLAGQNGVGAGAPSSVEQNREDTLQTQRLQETDANREESLQIEATAATEEGPVTEEIGQNVNFTA